MKKIYFNQKGAVLPTTFLFVLILTMITLAMFTAVQMNQTLNRKIIQQELASIHLQNRMYHYLNQCVLLQPSVTQEALILETGDSIQIIKRDAIPGYYIVELSHSKQTARIHAEVIFYSTHYQIVKWGVVYANG